MKTYLWSSVAIFSFSVCAFAGFVEKFSTENVLPAVPRGVYVPTLVDGRVESRSATLFGTPSPELVMHCFPSSPANQAAQNHCAVHINVNYKFVDSNSKEVVVDSQYENEFFTFAGFFPEGEFSSTEFVGNSSHGYPAKLILKRSKNGTLSVELCILQSLNSETKKRSIFPLFQNHSAGSVRSGKQHTRWFRIFASDLTVSSKP